MAALVNASKPGDPGFDVTSDMIYEEWHDPRLSLDEDTWVAVTPEGEYAAAVEIWFEEPDEAPADEPVTRHIGLAVHPDYRESHLALIKQLFEGALERAMGRPLADPTRPAVLRMWAPANDAWKQEWISSYGFQYTHCGFTLIHDRLDELPALPRVPNVEIRAWQPQLDYDLWQVVNACFSDDPTYVDLSWEEWNRIYHDSPKVDPNLWRLAVDSRTDEIVGFLLSEIDNIALDVGSPQEGWITDLAVLPDWRGRGVRALLVRPALDGMHGAGVREVLAGVGSFSPTVATRHYDAVGFRILRGVCTYLRPFSQQAES